LNFVVFSFIFKLLQQKLIYFGGSGFEPIDAPLNTPMTTSL